jgi:transmembrane sensor
MGPVGNKKQDVQEAAAGWVVELPGSSLEARTRFSEWLTQQPRHVDEYLLAAALYTELDTVQPARPVNRGQLIADAMEDIRTTSPLSDRVFGARRWRMSSRAIAAGLACMAAAFLTFWLIGTGPREHTTRIGEVRSFELEDGTIVHLNADSRVAVDYSARARTVRLLRGEALFKIGRDAGRPFQVTTGAVRVQALGTQFNMNQRVSGTNIVVLEGRVQVTQEGRGADRIGAGEGIRVMPTGGMARLPGADIERATAWLQRRLVFLDDPLPDIATEFNRFNRTPRIRIEGADARAVLVSGVFDADDPESFLLYLSGRRDLTVDVKADLAIIRGN